MSNDVAIAVSGINQKYLSANKMNTSDKETAIFETKMDLLKLSFPKIKFVTGAINKITDNDLKMKKIKTHARSFVNSFIYKIGLFESSKI